MHELIRAARTAREDAIAPYSGFPVGAAIETDSGDVITGANIEFSNWSNTLHAEEVALARALHEGYHSLSAIGLSSSNPETDEISPCGMCRQSLREYTNREFPVLMDRGDSYERRTIGELLPLSEKTVEP